MKFYSRNVDGEVRPEDLRPLPEAVQGRDHGAREQLVQDRLHERDLCLGHCSLVAQVRQAPGAEKRYNIQNNNSQTFQSFL